LAMGLGDGSAAVLLLAFESAVVADFGPQLAACKAMCEAVGGAWSLNAKKRGKQAGGDGQGDATTTWKNNFIQAPYLRDAFALEGACGRVCDRVSV